MNGTSCCHLRFATPADKAEIARHVYAPSHVPSIARAPTPASVNSPAPAAGYTLITDEELFALLPDEPLLITTRPDGSRDIVLLARAKLRF